MSSTSVAGQSCQSRHRTSHKLIQPRITNIARQGEEGYNPASTLEDNMPKALVLGGATGLLGKSLMATLASAGWESQSLGRENGRLPDLDFLRSELEAANADVIFNTIAWTQVDAAEDNPEEALEVNRTFADGLARIIAAMDKGHLVHYSTDFVFSGQHAEPWRETDTPCPASVYGKTKLEGEKAVLGLLPQRSCVVRTAWLFGPGRKNFVRTILDICKKQDTVQVVTDQIGSPTYAPDLALWSIPLAEKRATGIWHAVNSGHASWCELASEAALLANVPARIVPIRSEQWPQKATRPVNSVLDNTKLSEFIGKKPRCWPQALRDYIFGCYLPKEIAS